MKIEKFHDDVNRVSGILIRIKAQNQKALNIVGRKKLVELSEELCEVTVHMINEGLMTDVKKPITNDCLISLLWWNGLLLMALVAFMTMQFYAIQTLESKVFPTGRLFVEETK